jgi:hypothetical protein
VAAGAKAVDEANKGLPDDKRDAVLDDVRKAAETKAADDCHGQYGSTHLGVVGLVAALLNLLVGGPGLDLWIQAIVTSAGLLATGNGPRAAAARLL